MKDLKNLKGAKMISKNEQRSIKGGGFVFPKLCLHDSDCLTNQYCVVYDDNGSGFCAWIEDPILP